MLKVKNILHQIAQKENLELLNAKALSGGSINEVFLLETDVGKRIIKINAASKFPNMFQAEKTGLESLENANTLDVPKFFSVGEIGKTAYLLMEYKPEGNPVPGFWENFAEGLAKLHRNSNSHFGFSASNYIGSLPQYNGKESAAAEFYTNQRLEPQFKMASENGFSFKNLDKVFQNISQEIPDESPALIHGDLWSGNYLVNEKGLPCLIDPAVCYGPREMDLAMMKLFGGFSTEVFTKYHENFPLEPGFEKRIPLWQLYYLLVHLNIFGSGYFSQVGSIVKKYS